MSNNGPKIEYEAAEDSTDDEQDANLDKGRNVTMTDANDDETDGENGIYSDRPHNHSTTLRFHELFTTLFTPLNENKKRPTAAANKSRKKQGPHGPTTRTPHEQRRDIVQRFISRWRKEVGNDIYPAFRLIVPEKDRDRPMYGLKEKTIGKLLVRMMRIDKNSEDGFNLLNWKLPGAKSTSAMAGDFAGRCFEVLQKRPIRTSLGRLTIDEVNEMLDNLSAAQKEDDQLPIFESFYKQMNPEEMMWLIRIILRQMKIGATERTIFEIWHSDADNLFNVSSSLRRVCWELSDPGTRLDNDDRGVKLMQCFQPQLAAFQMSSMERIVARMGLTEHDPVFWIEEKLDGERMQLHMQSEPKHPGGKRFNFWSRKAKDYTYLYGNGLEDSNGALTRHLKSAFNSKVRNIILDGEMITWNPVESAIVPFGTLKTAALSEQRDPFATGNRPVFRIFDCLYLNDQPLTSYTLRDRRKALASAVSSVDHRFVIHEYAEARTTDDIEEKLRKVIEESSEGLVLKNPRSPYRLNERNDDWMKVKPEYMTEFGEALDCLVIGGYYGSGHRGGKLSSFLCGLRVDDTQIRLGANPMKFYSFFKVGGGFAAADYADLRHRTEGKWIDWDVKKPPTEYIELGGGDRQFERPDVWIKPTDSVVLEVKAASVHFTELFRFLRTLRFPRFKRVRTDKDWQTALSMADFDNVQRKAEAEKKDKQIKIDDSRRKAPKRARKKATVLVGADEQSTTIADAPTASNKLFEGHEFYVMSECLAPKTSKVDLEQLVKTHGGSIVQLPKDKDCIILADRNLVKVASIVKAGLHSIVRPAWLLDCIKQAEIDVGRPRFLLPFEPGHMYFCTEDDHSSVAATVDEYGDSYTRDVDWQHLQGLISEMVKSEDLADIDAIRVRFQDSVDGELLPASLFRKCRVLVEGADTDEVRDIKRSLLFGGAEVVETLDDDRLSHVVVLSGSGETGKGIRRGISTRRALPRLVTAEWVESSIRERTRLDEEKFALI